MLTQNNKLNETLEKINSYLKRFLFLHALPRKLLCVFIAYTYVYRHFDYAVYLMVHSAEKQSGKTRVLRHLQLLSKNADITSGGSSSALLRKVHTKSKEGYVMLLDEVDKMIANDSGDNKLFGLCNAGVEKGSPFEICEKNKEGNYIPQAFETFCPKAFGIIGAHLMDSATRDRCIEIQMRRKTVEETRQFNIERNVSQIVNSPKWTKVRNEIIQALEEWAKETECYDATIPVHKGISDRHFDIIEPLLQISSEADKKWTKAILDYITALEESNSELDLTNNQRLLRDCWLLFDEHELTNGDTFSPTQLQKWLIEEEVDEENRILSESGWLFYSHGRPISLKAISRLLGEYGISTKRNNKSSYYTKVDFNDSFERYLLPLLDNVTHATQGALDKVSEVLDVQSVVDSGGDVLPDRSSGVRTKSQYNDYDPDNPLNNTH